MCGRFVVDFPGHQLHVLFGTVNPTANLAPSWNVAPTRSAWVVRRHAESGERHLDPLSWGLLPLWADAATAKRPFNARSETAAKLPSFRAALASRRAIIPARAFYEWRRVGGTDGKPVKEPFAIGRADGAPLAFAGLWERHRDAAGEVVRSFAILTCAANATLRPLHERMPVVLEPADWSLWLGEAEGDAAGLMVPAAEGVLRLWPVSSRVNSVRNDDAALLDEQVTSSTAGGPNPQ